MLKTMRATCKTEMQDQEKAWMGFRQWCDDTNGQKTRQSEQLEIDLDEATAGSKASAATIEELTTKLQTADKAVATAADDLGAIANQRGAANEKYQKKKLELTQSISACHEALNVLSNVSENAVAAQPHTGAAPAAVAQPITFTMRGYSLIQTKVMKALEGKTGSGFTAIRIAFLQQPAQGNRLAIQKSSGKIISLISELEASLSSELSELDAAERTDSEAYFLEQQAMENTHATNTKASADRTRDIGVATGEKSDFDNTISHTTAALKKNKNYMKRLGNECEVKAKDYIREAKSRDDEMVAIDQAVEILSGAAANNGGAVLTAQGSSTAAGTEPQVFLQLDSKPGRKQLENLARFLKERSAKLGGNRELMQIAARVQAGDPFVTIKKLIGDMITQMSHEKRDEIAGANSCETDLAASMKKIAAATAEVEKTTSDKGKLEVAIDTKQNHVEELIETLNDSTASLAELTSERAQERAANGKAVTELQEGSAALQQAIAVLSEFYENAGDGGKNFEEGESLNSDFSPSNAHSGQDASTQILGLLTEIESDMRVQEVSITTDEKKAREEFTMTDREAKVDIATTKQDLANGKQVLSQLQEDLVSAKESLEKAEDTLKKEQEYKRVHLDPKCVETGVSFENRAIRRQEEIASLQDAMKILNQVVAL